MCARIIFYTRLLFWNNQIQAFFLPSMWCTHLLNKFPSVGVYFGLHALLSAAEEPRVVGLDVSRHDDRWGGFRTRRSLASTITLQLGLIWRRKVSKRVGDQTKILLTLIGVLKTCKHTSILSAFSSVLSLPTTKAREKDFVGQAPYLAPAACESARPPRSQCTQLAPVWVHAAAAVLQV